MPYPLNVTKAHHLVTRVATTAFNDCYSKLVPYKALAKSYWVRYHDNAKATPINDKDLFLYFEEESQSKVVINLTLK